jgi:hypothetical protein
MKAGRVSASKISSLGDAIIPQRKMRKIEDFNYPQTAPPTPGGVKFVREPTGRLGRRGDAPRSPGRSRFSSRQILGCRFSNDLLAQQIRHAMQDFACRSESSSLEYSLVPSEDGAAAMLSRRSRSSWRPRLRTWCAGVALFAYLIAALGIPLPIFPHKKSGPPFPCQNRRCGCLTAEQCWRSCCCMTPAERWAWAREHNVEPPAYAERPASRASCCSPAPDADSCGDGKCCTTHSHPPRPAQKPRPTSSGLRWGPSLSALTCQGLSVLWVTSGAALPSVPAPALGVSPVQVEWLIPSDIHAIRLVVPPHVPPPRVRPA